MNELALYPMVEEEEAAGRVAAVYAQVRQRMPLVPSIVKSLAVCPPYLTLAWQQAASAFDDPGFIAAAQELAASARTVATPPPQPEVRAALARFVTPLSQMLMLATGLREAVHGRVSGPVADGEIPSAVGAPPTVRDTPSAREVDAAQLFGQKRAAGPRVDEHVRGLILRSWVRPRAQQRGRRGRRARAR